MFLGKLLSICPQETNSVGTHIQLHIAVSVCLHMNAGNAPFVKNKFLSFISLGSFDFDQHVVINVAVKVYAII